MFSIVFPSQALLPLDNIRSDFTQMVSMSFLKKHVMVPLSGKRAKDGHDTIAVNDPALLQPIDDLARMLSQEHVTLVLSTRESILTAISLSYDLSRDSAQQLVQDMEENSQMIIGEIEDTSDLLDDVSDAPIIRLVNHIVSESINARASDIHIEPYQDSFKVRYRIDGILYDLLTPPKWIQPALISRIKVMARMNIAEKRLPQDGRFNVRVGEQEIDVRVSTIPTSFGERLVLRLLNKTSCAVRTVRTGAEFPAAGAHQPAGRILPMVSFS